MRYKYYVLHFKDNANGTGHVNFIQTFPLVGARRLVYVMHSSRILSYFEICYSCQGFIWTLFILSLLCTNRDERFVMAILLFYLAYTSLRPHFHMKTISRRDFVVGYTKPYKYNIFITFWDVQSEAKSNTKITFSLGSIVILILLGGALKFLETFVIISSKQSLQIKFQALLKYEE